MREVMYEYIFSVTFKLKGKMHLDKYLRWHFFQEKIKFKYVYLLGIINILELPGVMPIHFHFTSVPPFTNMD